MEIKNSLIDSGYLLSIMTDDFDSIDKQDEFLDYYPKWIKSSRLNSIAGLNAFPYRFVSLGCTQALDEFHFWCLQNNKRIRMFRGEYPYNRDCINFKWHEDFVDDHPLREGDALIISVPFSGSGDIHPNWNKIIEDCNKLDIPVIVDCAFFGTCRDIKINLNEDCIQSVVFSTTKGLSCGNYRNGIQFTKINSGHLSIQNEWHHGIHLNVSLGLFLMKKFNPDFLVEKYIDSYKEVCKLFSLKETKCIHLALGDNQWNHFTRDGRFNRIGLKNPIRDHFKAFKNGKSYKIPDIKN